MHQESLEGSVAAPRHWHDYYVVIAARESWGSQRWGDFSNRSITATWTYEKLWGSWRMKVKGHTFKFS